MEWIATATTWLPRSTREAQASLVDLWVYPDPAGSKYLISQDFDDDLRQQEKENIYQKPSTSSSGRSAPAE